MDSRDSASEHGEAKSLAGDSQPSRVLVTGAAGFLGRSVVERLLAEGWAVEAVTSAERAEFGESREGLHWHRADLLDPAATDQLLAQVGATHLVHLAWAPNRGVYDSPENARWLTASQRLFSSFIERGGRRALAAGSSAEYDWSAGICREDSTPLAGGGAYGEAKRALGETFGGLFGGAERSSGVWARIFFLFGPGEPDGRLVPSVARALFDDGPVRCSEGLQVRDYLYVEDAADALVRLLASDLIGAINVASGAGVRVRDLVLALAERIGGTDRVEWGAPDKDPLVVADVERLERELDWRPPIGLSGGLDRTVEWWRERLELES